MNWHAHYTIPVTVVCDVDGDHDEHDQPTTKQLREALVARIAAMTDDEIEALVDYDGAEPEQADCGNAAEDAYDSAEAER